jgi:hypothetical protein
MTHPFHRHAQGSILVLTVVFLGIFVAVSGALLNYLTSSLRLERSTVASAQALTIAEGALDKAVSAINQNTSYAGETNTALGAGTFTVTVSTVDSSTKRVTATASVPNSTNPIATKTIKATFSIDTANVSFHYGVQSGAGGFSLTGGSVINGSIYSNGDISATTGVHITGSAIAANPAATSTDQSNATPVPIASCTSSTCITFGNASATQDIAQSFVISTSQPLNSMQFYIKKVGSPADATIRIVNDASGSPSTDVLMTGTLSAASVTTSFGWVTVDLPSTPVLDPAQTYWVVIDAASSASKYYIIGANAGGYASGTAKIGQYSSSWSATTPSGLDIYFQLYLGGGTSMIGGNSYNTGVYVGTTASDNAWAHTVMGATVTGALYCKVGSFTSKACNTSQADPTPAPLPLSDNNIQDWKDDALSGGTLTGDYHVGSGGATLGPKKIIGNLTVDGGGTLTLTGTLWITGNVTVNSGGKVKLDATYGANDGALVSDGYVVLTGGANFAGSGVAGSYPFLVTTSSCPAEAGCSGNPAISLSGGTGTVALIAQDGTVHISGGSSLKAVTGKQISMDGGATLTYDSGLINANFTSGPGASWTISAGSYAITR